MKKLILLSALCMLISGGIYAQEFPKLDGSPMDASYFPPRAAFRTFAKTDEEKMAGTPKIKVVYGRPKKKERVIFGDLQKYGEMWRLGANESTEITFFSDATVNGTKLKSGRYTVYAIPSESEWEIFFSSDLDGWGHYGFKPEESTLAKIKVPTQKTAATVEALSILFEVSDSGANMIIGWDDTMVKVPIGI
ncbi:MAG: DUF2911 domain-containing protein [Cyclobacteriaceae bacterium]